MLRGRPSHVDLTVTDRDRSVRFYGQVLGRLGYQRVTEAAGAPCWQVGGGPGGVFSIALQRARPGSAPKPHDRYAPGLHHLAFHVDGREQVDAFHAFLGEIGAAVLDPPAEYAYSPGYYALFFADPDGLKLEVVHEPALLERAGAVPAVPPHGFETERLSLRRPAVADAEAIFERYARDPDVTRYVAWPPHESPDVTREFLQGCLARWRSGDEFTWVIEEKPAGGAIGMLACRIPDHRASLGYVLARTHWGRGYAAEALGPVLDWLGTQPRVRRVWAVCDVENRASARVLEKVGMEREGVLRRWGVHPNLGPEPRDVLCYSLLREEARRRSGSAGIHRSGSDGREAGGAERARRRAASTSVRK